MQTHVQVITKSIKSLREAIVNDPKLNDYFSVIKMQKKGRSPGWARLRSIDTRINGTLQIQWDSKTAILLCSVINKAAGRPDDVVGELIRYLLRKFIKQILVINIIP